jgi:hypothetical protein
LVTVDPRSLSFPAFGVIWSYLVLFGAIWS